jgi:inosine-uridine nucleoside N-ribohydrolase
MKIHLDTDLGGDIDDLCALALLLARPDVELTGVTTVGDEGGRRCGYVKYALRLAGRADVPVAAGADVSLGCFRWPMGYPDEAAYWPEPIAPSPNPLEEALDLLEHSIAQGATVVGIGPYTNLALLDQRRPGPLSAVPLYLMGFFVRPIPSGFPQWDFDTDWNVQSDVAAARHLLETQSPTVIPAEMTVQTALRRAYLPGLRRAGPLGALLARQAEAFALDERNEERYGQTCAGLPDDTINFQHDPLACAVALGWDGVQIETIPLRAEINDAGLLRAVPLDGGRPTPVVTRVDARRFDAWWYETVTRQPSA